MTPFTKQFTVLFFLLFCAPIKPLFAWGVEGHQVVAFIAQSKLTPKAAKEVKRILSIELGETLISISTWADEHRSRGTASWHYVNFPRGICDFVRDRDCPDGDCVVQALENQVHFLNSRVSHEERLLALKYIVHFMGDIHQPFHSGYEDDKGGNAYQLHAFGKGTNAHALWDTDLIRNFHEPFDVLGSRLMSQEKKTQRPIIFNPTLAAIESCKMLQSEDFYPSHELDQTYIQKATPIIEAQLLLAGERLAELLNTSFK